VNYNGVKGCVIPIEGEGNRKREMEHQQLAKEKVELKVIKDNPKNR
jgi:hypothetical protein